MKHGRAFGIDIRQFAFAGIPIYKMLQEEVGLTGEALSDFIEDGGVTFDLLEGMFKSATEEGGVWAGAFERQMGTLNQSVSNLQDNFTVFAIDFVRQTGLFDKAKEIIARVSDAIQDNRESIFSFGSTLVNVAEGAINIFGTSAGFLIEQAIKLNDVIIALTVSFGAMKIINGIRAAYLSWIAAHATLITSIKAGIVTLRIATASMGLFRGVMVSTAAFLAANPNRS